MGRASLKVMKRMHNVDSLLEMLSDDDYQTYRDAVRDLVDRLN